MLDRTKLAKCGSKYRREVVDPEYAELLIGKLMLLGAKMRNMDNYGVGDRLVVAIPDKDGTFPDLISFGQGCRWVLFKRPNEKYWTINTKVAHDFLMWHSRGKYE